MRELLYALLSLLTDLPRSSLPSLFPLPSYTTQHRAMHTLAVGRQQQLHDIMQQQQLVGLECDEGAFARLKHFVVLSILPFHQRHLLDVPVITSTTAEVSRDLRMANAVKGLLI